jgi:hypothetical protein
MRCEGLVELEGIVSMCDVPEHALRIRPEANANEIMRTLNLLCFLSTLLCDRPKHWVASGMFPRDSVLVHTRRVAQRNDRHATLCAFATSELSAPNEHGTA